MVRDAGALAKIAPDLQALHDSIRSQDIEQAMADIKQVESALSDIKNAHPVTSKLSRARRALKRSQDRDGAISEWLIAVQRIEQEISWRSAAQQRLLPALDELDDMIRHHIGLRLQPRLPAAQAEKIASCLAQHKDISLAF